GVVGSEGKRRAKIRDGHNRRVVVPLRRRPGCRGPRAIRIHPIQLALASPCLRTPLLHADTGVAAVASTGCGYRRRTPLPHRSARNGTSGATSVKSASSTDARLGVYHARRSNGPPSASAHTAKATVLVTIWWNAGGKSGSSARYHVHNGVSASTTPKTVHWNAAEVLGSARRMPSRKTHTATTSAGMYLISLVL